ncbi:transmembrane protein, putative [Medicago truncatula]|uniref:Transmembrane protein, putative n=1 Tax=Medicago truncatula TaxID=3880 RepID=A0A072U3F7_MEDTR|nr:transmembrane protein, putative [Medicago truncatula]
MNLAYSMRLPSSSRMNLSNGARLRSSSHPCKSIHDVGVFHRTLDYGFSRVIDRGVGHSVKLNYQVLPIRCLRQTSPLPTGDYETITNSSDNQRGSFTQLVSHHVALAFCFILLR